MQLSELLIYIFQSIKFHFSPRVKILNSIILIKFSCHKQRFK